MYLDSHCHLTDDRFVGEVDAVLRRAGEAGVDAVVSIASDEADALAVVELTETHAPVWGTAGIHPHVAADARPGDLDRIADLLRSRSRLVAVGETGLDYHYDNSPREVQRRRFREQAELAAELDLPVVVHSREADDDTRALVREMGGAVRGVLHCYTGGMPLLEEALEVGWYVSYSGIASFSSFGGKAGVRLAPRDRILVETDAPYLAPAPHRGKRNEPSYVPHVAAAVARIRDEDPEEVGRYTAANARSFYGI